MTTRRDVLHLAAAGAAAAVIPVAATAMACAPVTTGQFIEATDEGFIAHELPAGGPVQSHIKPLFEEWWALRNEPIEDEEDPYWEGVYYPRLDELEDAIQGMQATTVEELAMQVLVGTVDCGFGFDEPDFPNRLRVLAGVPIHVPRVRILRDDAASRNA